jgi:O-antigen ligase
MKARAKATIHRTNEPSVRQRFAWTSGLAMALALGLVIARACMTETLREPFAEIVAGDVAAPRPAGPATSLVLDLLCGVPVLLVLARSAVDRGERLRLAWPHLFMGLLAAWGMLSALWADDRFGAVVGAFHFVSAFALFVAASQLFGTWRRLHLLGAVALGLLLLYAANGVYYRFLDLPDLQRNWQENRASILRERGIEEGSYAARQFGQKIENGEMIGFNASPNSFAAVLSLLVIVAGGLLIQRQSDGDGQAWILPYSLAILAGLWVMLYTHSKAAFGTVMLGAVLLALNRVMRRTLTTRSRTVYFGGVVALLLAMGAVIGHGVYHGSLLNDSLTFRWKYWVASARMFVERPLAGVGWGNFGLHYLAKRLPEAAEEIKDPHNFFVRFCVELGAVGGVLLVAWMLGLWWTLTRPVMPTADEDREEEGFLPGKSVVWKLAAIALLAMAINIVASVDLSAAAAFVLLELIKRAMFLLLLLGGMALAAIRSMERQEIDGRPAPWILHAMIIGVGLFLVHNLVDFSLFEIGPMFLFALLCGGALAIRLSGRAESTPDDQERRGLRAAVAVGAVLVWLLSLAIVGPIVWAEELAHEADTSARERRAPEAAGKLADAFGAVPYNAEYAFRSARTMLMGNTAKPQEAEAMLDRAIASNPSEIKYYLLRARIAMSEGGYDRARADFEKAIALNPNDVDIRLDFAEILKRTGHPADAGNQYRMALEANDRLNPDEPKRLPKGRVEEIHRAIDELK